MQYESERIEYKSQMIDDIYKESYPLLTKNREFIISELKKEIERYIKYYNEQRIKEKLGWMSPVEYRLTHLAA